MNKWTRRGFITTGILAGGMFAVGIAIRPGKRIAELSKLATKGNETLINIWVKIAPDNVVTAIVPHSEMGQGVMTALGAMLADEMDADWDKLVMEQAPAHEEYANSVIPRFYLAPGLRPPGIVEDTIDGAFLKIAKTMGFQTTGGSMSVRGTGMHGLRLAGSAARQMLIEGAAEKWSVPKDELRTDKSMIFHDKSKRFAPYAEFASAAAKGSPPRYPALKSPDEFRLMGRSIPRTDVPAKVDGSAVFGIDVTLPGMKFAAIKQPPVFGAKIATLDAEAAHKMPGVITIINLGDFVAVVADSYWQAKTALDAVSMTFTRTENDTVSSADIFARQTKAIDVAAKEGGDILLKKGDAAAALAEAVKKLDAEYRVPFLAHVTMEPMNATAWVHDGRCEVWAGMQNPLGSRNAVAEAIDFNTDNVIMHNVFLGGGFGRRGRPDYTNQAARIAQKVTFPVKMIWSREEDVRQDFYRPAAISRMTAAFDAAGKPTAWVSHNVELHDPKEAAHIPYAIDNQLIDFADSANHVRFGAWRSVDHSQQGFFTESFVDEMAHFAGKDPYQFRRSLLAGSPRHLAVLDRAAKMANWGSPLAKGQGRGIALVDSFGTVVAQVAQVDLTGTTPRVTDVFCAADPGYAMNPDGFAAQMESGIIYGLTAALFGDITLENGAVQQSNLHDYEMIRMDNAPKITVEIINSGAVVGGGGEPGTPPIAPAVTNAIFAITGTRIRALPVKNAGPLTLA
jgi:isoquinoline 1-oxidoreductase subunit beta